MINGVQNQRRYRDGIASVLRRCPAYAPVLICLLGGAAQAGTWEDFQSRCLDPYENLEPAVFDDLTALEIAEPRIEISRYGGHFTLENGAVLTSDPAPLGEGERLCAVSGPINGEDAQAWVTEQLAKKYYEIAERSADGSYVTLTNLWIEPKLSVTFQYELGGKHALFQITEALLES
jgi:hypothetical protein